LGGRVEAVGAFGALAARADCFACVCPQNDEEGSVDIAVIDKYLEEGPWESYSPDALPGDNLLRVSLRRPLSLSISLSSARHLYIYICILLFSLSLSDSASLPCGVRKARTLPVMMLVLPHASLSLLALCSLLFHYTQTTCAV